MYSKQRSDDRVPFISTCLLEINGHKINCLLDNISTTGVLIEVPESELKKIHTGEVGILKVILLSPVNYLCRIVRISSNKVAMEFVEQ